MEEVLNEKFGITVDYQTDNGILGKVHFYSANGVELDAFVMEDVEDYQNQIKEEIEVVKNLKTEFDVTKFIEKYSNFEIARSVDVYDYILDFKSFTIRVVNN